MNEIQSFAQLDLCAPLLQVLAEVGYETPTPIQAACIPPLLAGRDLVGEAQTGTGKTAAFALPLLQRLDLERLSPQVLVLTPTRELAIQVAEAFQKYAHRLPGFHVLPVYGGQGMALQLRQLRRGVHLIVGTPGRVMDHLERQSLDLSGLRALVLDEADEMLRMGFIDDVEWILEHTPAERQTALFSATLPDAIRRVAERHLRDPAEIKIRAATTTVAATRQLYWQVRGADKLEALTRMLEVEEDLDAALVFVRTKTATLELADRLEARGYAAAALNGDMPQGQRERVIEQLRGGGLDILVATDVAARGIDVPRISHVINYDLPHDVESYVHRIGRTGRAGRSGTAILFVQTREMRLLRAIERATRQPIEPMGLPSRAAVTDRRVAQFKAQVLEVLEGEKLDFLTDLVRGLEEDQGLAPREIAAALAWLAQRDRPLQPEAPELPPMERETPRPLPTPAAPAVAPARRGTGPTYYRIEVGRAHGVHPKEIVGAIANEGGLEGRAIGDIRLLEEFSLVELPADLPDEVLRLLQRARVREQALALRLWEGEVPETDRAPRDPRAERPGRPFRDQPRDYGGERPNRPFRGQGDRPYGERPRPERPYREGYPSDRPGPRPDRPYRGEQPFRPDRPGPRAERPYREGYPVDRPGPRPDRPYRGEQPFRPDRPGSRTERPVRAEYRPDRAGPRPDRPYRDERPARRDTVFRPAGTEPGFRPERPAGYARAERPDRPAYRPEPRPGGGKPPRRRS